MAEAGPAGLPWRGPDGARPPLAVPPEPMPLRLGGRWRKRWRYVGAYDEELMLCGAAVEVGPLSQEFWAVWERGQRRMHERTRMLLPGMRPRVQTVGRALRVRARDLEIELRLGEGAAIESICPNDRDGYTWTRKLAGLPVEGSVRVAGREHRMRARGVLDESAGYHARRTSWLWSAGVGEAVDGRALAWNLVSGINDPPRCSERAIWIDGEPSEPGPVRFHGLEAIELADGSRLEFAAEGERARREAVPPLFRSDYRAPFGSFAGSLAGLRLASGLGVMERHDALW